MCAFVLEVNGSTEYRTNFVRRGVHHSAVPEHFPTFFVVCIQPLAITFFFFFGKSAELYSAVDMYEYYW